MKSDIAENIENVSFSYNSNQKFQWFSKRACIYRYVTKLLEASTIVNAVLEH